MDIPKEFQNEDISYCLRTPVFVFEATFSKGQLRLTVIDQESSKSYESVYTENCAKIRNLARGICDPLDLFLIFFPANQGKQKLGEKNLCGENLKNETGSQVGLQYNQKINNGKNWFMVGKNGLIKGGSQFSQEANIKRNFSTEFEIVLGWKNSQKSEKQMPKNEQTLAIKELKDELDQKLQVIRRDIENNLEKKMMEKLNGIEKQLERKYGKRQISHAQAKKKYIDDLCD